MFRARAAGFYDAVPDPANTDEWRFLARHAGLPTRLLDWCEGALIGLHFPRKEDHPAVWMLNPVELNDFASNRTSSDPKEIRVFPFVWHRPDLPIVNPAFELGEPWELNSPGVPVARGYLSDMRSSTVAYPTRVFHHIRKAEGLNPSRRVEKSVLLERGLHDRQRCCSRGYLDYPMVGPRALPKAHSILAACAIPDN